LFYGFIGIAIAVKRKSDSTKPAKHRPSRMKNDATDAIPGLTGNDILRTTSANRPVTGTGKGHLREPEMTERQETHQGILQRPDAFR